METVNQAFNRGLPAHEFLHIMAAARECDRREGLLLRQNKGWFQVSGAGHEALGAICCAMQPEDFLFPYYRDRAMALARGVSIRELALAYFAKAASSSGGRQMPGHYSDRRRGIFSSATPTASQCLPAAGAAWGFKLDGSGRVSVVTVGDASTRQGEFYEAISLAIQEELPIVFVIEDNHYGISTPTYAMFPYRLQVLSSERVTKINGRDPFEVYEHAEIALERARSGAGPTILWCDLDRLASHTSSDDQRLYKQPDELALEQSRDPIRIFADRLIGARVISRQDWEREQESIALEVDHEYQRASHSEDPQPQDVTKHLFAESTAPSIPTLPFSLSNPASIVSAVNETLAYFVSHHSECVVYGEDIADPKGGVFGLTKGLSTSHPTQVFNAPLAEATIIGAGVGLSAAGRKPIVEMQFIDFITPAFNQLTNQAANLRWRTAGDWNCSMVILAPYGAYLPGGSLWHSESNEGIWAHVHGLRVVIPSTPEDAAGLLWSAYHSEDPVLFLLPKHIFRVKHSVASSLVPVPFGVAAIRRTGTDVTVVSWGNGMELAEQAATSLASAPDPVSVEIIDLRTICPCDYETIASSVAKTGRLVVIQEDARTTGFGQSIITEIVSKPDWFYTLVSPPQLAARTDTPIPYNPLLEYAALPSLADVCNAIRTTMEQ
jgi:2-oxoisovalerate dehydrogenase E1 component